MGGWSSVTAEEPLQIPQPTKVVFLPANVVAGCIGIPEVPTTYQPERSSTSRASVQSLKCGIGGERLPFARRQFEAEK